MLAKIDFSTGIAADLMNGIRNLSTRNFFDILIIAFLIYAVIKLLRETHSISVVAGVLTLLGFYGIAVLFDLPLTNLVLRSFFGVFLILIAVIFQRELRRFFSAFGFLGIARRFMPPSEAVIGIVAHAAAQLAREKTGVLIVFPGREAIERHLEGGYRLNGEVSEPLLFSIFDKTSPGHDGATIIDHNRIKKFAVHLPLAEHIDEIRHLGLRHRAALGLSERSDALIVAVSEERGVISIAQNGELHQLKDKQELKQKLVDFYAEKFPKLNVKNFFRWLTKNVLLLVISFLIALGIFSLLNSRFAFVQRNFAVVPDFINIPTEVIINDINPEEIILTLRGRGTDFDAFKPENLRILIDIGAITNIAKPGWHGMPVEATDIRMPFNLSLVKIDPQNIRIQIIKNVSAPAIQKKS
ncbi:MAG: diadenylate cyclase [bacterium]|nr:diadenylate cyclase [bacterium]